MADFSAGAGSAQLEVQIAEDWLPVGNPATASISTVLFFGRKTGPLLWRWNVTVETGAITTYID
jgi:hypothetical protein